MPLGNQPDQPHRDSQKQADTHEMKPPASRPRGKVFDLAMARIFRVRPDREQGTLIMEDEGRFRPPRGAELFKLRTLRQRVFEFYGTEPDARLEIDIAMAWPNPETGKMLVAFHVYDSDGFAVLPERDLRPYYSVRGLGDGVVWERVNPMYLAVHEGSVGGVADIQMVEPLFTPDAHSLAFRHFRERVLSIDPDRGTIPGREENGPASFVFSAVAGAIGENARMREKVTGKMLCLDRVLRVENMSSDVYKVTALMNHAERVSGANVEVFAPKKEQHMVWLSVSPETGALKTHHYGYTPAA